MGLADIQYVSIDFQVVFNSLQPSGPGPPPERVGRGTAWARRAAAPGRPASLFLACACGAEAWVSWEMGKVQQERARSHRMHGCMLACITRASRANALAMSRATPPRARACCRGCRRSTARSKRLSETRSTMPNTLPGSVVPDCNILLIMNRPVMVSWCHCRCPDFVLLLHRARRPSPRLLAH